MPKLRKALARDRKRAKRKHGMVVRGRSIFTLVEEIEKKAEDAKKKRKRRRK